MHELLHWVASCAALSVAAEFASPGALAAALGGMLCCTSVAAEFALPGALAAALGDLLCCTSVATGASLCFSYKQRLHIALHAVNFMVPNEPWAALLEA